MKILITGGAGYLGGRISEKLHKTHDLILLDVREPRKVPRGVKFVKMDIRDERLPELIKKEKVKLVIHLAFVLNPPENREEARSINIDGTANVLRAVVRGGAEWIMVTSSTTAYGAKPEHITPCREDAPLYGWIHKGAWYPEDKVVQEIIIGNFKVNHPEVKVTVIRPCIVAGKNMKNYIADLLFEFPMIGKIGGANPPFQFIHEDDLAEAVMLLIEKNAGGIFNAVGRGMLTLEDIARLTGKRSIYFPRVLLPVFIKLANRITGYPLPPQMADYFIYPWLADGSKLYSLGFSPHYTAEEVLLEAWESHKSSGKS